jgi:hypothetical protein
VREEDDGRKREKKRESERERKGEAEEKEAWSEELHTKTGVLLAKRKRSHDAAINTLHHLQLTFTS